MPVPDLSGVPPWAEFEDLKNKINDIVAKYNNLLVNLDTLNIVSLNAKVIEAGTITGDKIAANTITANNIAANTITADKMNVNELSAISANLGHITAGLIETVEMIGSVITGGVLQTAATGNRIVINQSGFVSFDGFNTKRVALGVNESEGMAGHAYYGPTGSFEGQIYSVNGGFHIIADDELFLRGFGRILMQGNVDFDDDVTFDDDSTITFNGDVVFNGTVDFTNATVIGL
jgi:hypothetical protein